MSEPKARADMEATGIIALMSSTYTFNDLTARLEAFAQAERRLGRAEAFREAADEFSPDAVDPRVKGLCAQLALWFMRKAEEEAAAIRQQGGG